MVNIFSYGKLSLSTFVINLSKRFDVLAHIKNQFDGRKEFDLTVVDVYKSEIQSVAYWGSLRKAISSAIECDDDVIIICEDQHEFSSCYNRDDLFNHIISGAGQGVKVMLGGVYNFGLAVPVAPGRFWIDRFEGTKFMIIYRSFFAAMLVESFSENDNVYQKISEMTSHKMLIYPFISESKEFVCNKIDYDKLSKKKPALMMKESMERLERICNIALKYKK